MSFAADVVSFTLPGDTSAVVLSPALGGLTPKALIALTVGGATDIFGANSTADQMISRGFWANSKKRAAASYSTNASAPSFARQVFRDDCILCEIDPSGALVGKLTVTSVGANSVTLTPSVAFNLPYDCFLVVLAGTDIANADIVDFTKSTTAGTTTQDVAAGFAPLYAEILHIGSTGALDAPPISSGCLQLGRAAPANGEYHVLLGESRDNQFTTSTKSYCTDAQGSIALSSATAIGGRATISASGNNVRFSWLSNDTNATQMSMLVLGGTFQVKLTSFTTLTSTGAITVTAGFSPVISMLASHTKTKSTSGTLQNGSEWAEGAVRTPTPSSHQSALVVHDEDADASAECAYAELLGNAVYVNVDKTGTVEGSISATGNTSTALSLNQDDADPSAAFVGVAIFGAAPVTSRLKDMIGRRMPLPWSRA